MKTLRALRAYIQSQGGLWAVLKDGYGSMSERERQGLYALGAVTFVATFALALLIAR